mmetsp:Transcript_24021/g.32913  ORF Transcript_24021/g.32913 Transcript_24021/m.32913 type:complete len:87 (-) Transcript_24021:181-441(-)
MSSSVNEEHQYRNPLHSKESVQNDVAMDTLMEELKEMQQKTVEWKRPKKFLGWRKLLLRWRNLFKPKAGSSCSHMHVEFWDGKFMC